jgi:hypothetical protein
MALDLQSEPYMKGHLVGPGRYQLTLLVAAENSEPREYTVELFLSGQFNDSQEAMLAQEVQIKLGSS